MFPILMWYESETMRFCLIKNAYISILECLKKVLIIKKAETICAIVFHFIWKLVSYKIYIVLNKLWSCLVTS